MRIGSYTVGDRLGRGAFSVVFRARAADGRVLALKVLDESEHDREALDRFLREARIAARLVDDAVPRIHEIGRDGPKHFIAMDLVEGESLDAVLRTRRRLPAGEVADIAVQLARVLSVAHATGIVHRDIKPANVILRPGGEVKLLDFGLSHMAGMQSISAPGVLVGTVPYMSPEQLLGEPVDARSDVFSAGVVLYELLAGARPFPGERFETVSHAILNVPPRRLSEHDVRVPEAVERVVFKSLMKRPEDRYASAGELLHDWELVALDPVASASAPLIARASVFARDGRTAYSALVGRDETIARIDRVLGGARAGGGTLVAVAGEGGAGKTRLLEAAAERATGLGLEVIETRCQAGRGTRAYQAWADLLQRYVERHGAHTPEGIRELLESMGLGLQRRMLDLFLRTPDPAAEQPTSTRGLWEALIAFWRAAAAARPVVVTIDDLHRADPLTLQFLGHLTSNLRATPLVVVSSHRTGAADDDAAAADLEEALAEARRADRLVTLAVEPLAREEVRALIDSRFGPIEGAPSLVDRVVAESEGNPLYVVEMLKMLEAEGRLVEADGRWTLASDLEDVPIPEKVVDLLRHRLARLGRDDRDLLDAAAVAGDDFPAKVLADCLASTQLEVLRCLRRLEQRSGIVVSSERGFRFAQSKLREYLLESIPPELRTAYHRSIAETYVAIVGDDDDRAAEIAEHFIAGGRPEAAPPYLERSGDRSFRFFANDAALDAYERARELVEAHHPDAPLTDRCRIGRKTTAVELRLSRLEEAVLTASVALRLARRAGDVRERGEALLVLAEAHVHMGDEERALAAFREAREQFEAAGDDDGRSRALDHEGNVLQRQGRHEEALALYREALGRREVLGSPVAVANSHYRIGSVLKRLGRLDESLEQLTRAREVLEGAGEAVTAASTSGEIGSVHLMTGDFDAAAAEYGRCLDVMRAAGERRRLAIALMNAGSAELYRGHLGRAQSLYRECLAIRLDVNDGFGIGLVQSNLAAVFRYQARYREAILAAHDAMEYLRDAKDPFYPAEAATQRGWIALETGEPAAARERFEEALAILRQKPDARRVAECHLALAEVAAAVGDPAEANRCLGAARESGGEHWPALAPDARLVRADLAAAAGAREEAAALAREAFETAAHADLRSRLRVETGYLLHAVRGGGEHARTAGLAIADALGAVQRARLRGFELVLRVARAELLAATDREAALGEMRLALAVADPILRDLPAGAAAGWAVRSRYGEALDALEAWVAEASGEGVGVGEEVARRRRELAAGTADRARSGTTSTATTTRRDS